MDTPNDIELLEKAQRWAVDGHRGVNRKFSELPYIVHPEAVAQIIAEITDDPEVIAAAWLHDIEEDTDKTIEDIREAFTDRVAELVREVSKVSSKGDGNRLLRRHLDKLHYAKASKWGKAIKIADSIHNLPTMIRDNPDFAPKYVQEKEELLEEIKDGSPLLATILGDIIADFKNGLTPIDLYSKIRENKQ